jgi:hypothetical protein
MGAPLAALRDGDPATPFASDAAAGAGSDALLRLLATLGGGAVETAKLPGKVWQGQVDPLSDEGIGGAFDLAGMAMTGGVGGVATRAGETALGSGPIRAYHGSPHDFDRFDFSKIGTGEGAQAYGHGLYFAENEGVAADYRKKLAGGAYQGLDTWFTKADTPEATRARQFLRDYGNDPVAASAVLHSEGDTVSRAAADLIRGAKGQWETKTPGKMYEVGIHADPERFLDWDKPLSGQPAQEVLASYGIHAQQEGWPRMSDKIGAPFENVPMAPVYGSEAYQRLVRNVGKTTEIKSPENQANVASQLLNNAGIPGIKYLDQGSRSTGAGSRNYVVFNDQLVEILKKYGLAGLAIPGVAEMAAGGGKAQAAEPPAANDEFLKGFEKHLYDLTGKTPPDDYNGWVSQVRERARPGRTGPQRPVPAMIGIRG